MLCWGANIKNEYESGKRIDGDDILCAGYASCYHSESICTSGDVYCNGNDCCVGDIFCNGNTACIYNDDYHASTVYTYDMDQDFQIWIQQG